MAARRGEGGADGDDPASASGSRGGGRLMGQEAAAGQALVADASSRWAGVVSSKVGGIADQDVDRVEPVVGLVAECAHGLGVAKVSRQGAAWPLLSVLCVASSSGVLSSSSGARVQTKTACTYDGYPTD
ncbi:hypothetical protein [Streptomyces sp. NPDC008122]|uniref:hypothetical protein n=1 Tax=Streptomyces sp. NPDC008122 TaxID=3364810 RepID=UPI0036EE69C7